MPALTRLVWDQLNVQSRLSGRAFEGLWMAGEIVLEEATTRCPHKTGTLMNSGVVTGGEMNGRATVSVSYDTPYAVKLHEGVNFRFRKGRQAKWLETALAVTAPKIEEIIQKYIGFELG